MYTVVAVTSATASKMFVKASPKTTPPPPPGWSATATLKQLKNVCKASSK